MAEVATLSTQQATTEKIFAPTVGSKVTVTSISQAQQLIAQAEAKLRQLDAEWNAALDASLKWENLSETASSDSLRAAAETQMERYAENGDIILREIHKVDDALTYYRSEFERLRTATGLPAAPAKPTTGVAVPPPPPPSKTDKPTVKVVSSGLPFGLTQNQALAVIGIPLAILLVSNLAGSTS
jgi:acyl-CoA reductase-like NAD-dependent aldehyde dehydrogenase